MIISSPYLARYTEAYRRRLYLNYRMFGTPEPVQALQINVNRFGTRDVPSPNASHNTIAKPQ